MISDQDFQRLSAYLDNQLLPAERSALEAKLAREPELKAALTDLRVQARALRGLPTLKPPRAFTLTASQAQAARGPRLWANLFPTLRLATAFSAAAFAVVLTLAVLTPPPPSGSVAFAPAAAPLSQAATAGGAAPTEAAPLFKGAAPLAPAVTATEAIAAAPSLSADTFSAYSNTAPLTVTAEITAAHALTESLASAPPMAEAATPAAGLAAAGVARTAAPAPTGAASPGNALAALSQPLAVGLGLLTALLGLLTWLARRR